MEHVLKCIGSAEDPPFYNSSPDYEPLPDVVLIESSRDSERPPGVRFGTHVHAILATVALCEYDEGEKVAGLQGRILGCTDDEVKAAGSVVNNVLTHELISRAKQAESCGQCRREAPFTIAGRNGTIIEVVIDLAFRFWTVGA